MAIHMELEYARRFERPVGTEGSEDGERGNANEAGAEEALPLPPKADVSWGHILAQNQVWRTVYSVLTLEGTIRGKGRRRLATLGARSDEPSCPFPTQGRRVLWASVCPLGEGVRAVADVPSSAWLCLG